MAAYNAGVGVSAALPRQAERAAVLPPTPPFLANGRRNTEMLKFRDTVVCDFHGYFPDARPEGNAVRSSDFMDFLKSTSLGRGLRPNELAALDRITELRELPGGSIITQRGTPGREVVILLSGLCLGLVQSRSGKEIVIERIGAGRVFGELAALDGGSRVRSVRAEGPVRVGVVSAPAFDTWLMETPRAMRNLLSDMAGNAREMADRYFEMAVHDVETRVRLMLIRLLIEGGALRDGGTLDPAPSHSAIAAHVGANREAVSRVISRFARMGFLDSGRRRIVVRDAAALEAGLRGPV